MTFLAPFAAIVAAAVTLPPLLALYLLKLRRRPVRVGSILFWPVAKEDVQANVPLKWLTPSWLLLLHLLILAAFVLALGRPVMMQGSLPATRVVLLLDTSASMQAVDEGQTVSRLELAKVRALELMDQLRRSGGRHQVCLVTFASQAQAVTAFTASRSVIEDALAVVAPTDQPGSLGAALKLVDAISSSGQEEESDTQDPPTAILLSDGSFGDQGKLPASATRLRFERVGPALPPKPAGEEDASAPSSEPRVAVIDNLGIVGLSARRDAQDPGMVRVFVDVLNTNAAGVPTPITLSINGVMMERRAIDVPGATGMGPGRGTTIFELRNADGGVLLASIGRVDALASDNGAGLVLPPAQRPAIILVEPDVAADAPTGERALTAAGWILEDVLAELRSQTFQTISANEYERRAEGGMLAGIDLVVFDRVTPRKLPNMATISFGGVPPGLGVSAGAESGGTSVLFWQRSHPIMRNVALDAVVLAKATPVVVAPEGGSSVTELMRGRDGPLLVLVQEGGAQGTGVRRIVAGFDLAMTNWPLQAGFPIFLADAVDYLTLRADAAAGRAFKTDEPVEVRVRPDSSGRVALKGPTNVVLRESGKPSPQGVLAAGVLARAGVYVVEGPSALDRAVAVNVLDEVESTLASPERVEVAGRVVEGVSVAATPREVWEWFVIAGLGLLGVEWFVYARSVRA